MLGPDPFSVPSVLAHATVELPTTPATGFRQAVRVASAGIPWRLSIWIQAKELGELDGIGPSASW